MSAERDLDFSEEDLFEDRNSEVQDVEFGAQSEGEDQQGVEGSASDSGSSLSFNREREEGGNGQSGSLGSEGSSFQQQPMSPSPPQSQHYIGPGESPSAPIALRSPRQLEALEMRTDTTQRAPSSRLFSSQSLPISAFKLGTSAPINIPMLEGFHRMNQAAKKFEPEDRILASTFVPPHLLDLQENADEPFWASGMTVTGVSPAASLKRVKLLQRNAILRRTGFIESGGRAALAEVMDPIRESQMEGAININGPLLERRIKNPSALSQALGTSPALAT